MNQPIRAMGLCAVLCVPFTAYGSGSWDGEIGHWTELPRRQTSTAEGQTVVLKDGRILDLGGFNAPFPAGGQPTKHCEIYDPRRPGDEWKPCAEMNDARAMFWAAVLPSGNVLVAGTFEFGNGPGPFTSEVYDVKRDEWVRVTSTPFPDQLANPHSIMTAQVLRDGTVLIAGGGYGGGGGLLLTNASFVFREDSKHPERGTWTRVGDVPYPFVSAAFVGLTDGRVLTAGGFQGTYPGFGTSGAKAAVYENGAWTAVPDMPYSVGTDDSAAERPEYFWGGPDCPPDGSPEYDPACVGNSHNPGSRWFPAGVALPGGDALVTSGMSRGRDSDPSIGFFGYGRRSSVRFDGATDTWAEAAPTATWHYFGRAVELPLGLVLLTGGYDVSTAEIYDPWHDRWYDAGGFDDRPACIDVAPGEPCYALDEFGGQLLRIDPLRVVQTCGYDYENPPTYTCNRAFLWSPGD